MNPEHLSDNQRAQLQFLTEANPRLYRACLLKEGLRLALKAGPEEIADALTKWMAGLSGAGFRPSVSCA